MIARVQPIMHWYSVFQFNFIIVFSGTTQYPLLLKFDFWVLLKYLSTYKKMSVKSFIIIGRVSSEALIEEKLLHAKSLFGLLHVWLEEISLQAWFSIMQVALSMLQFGTTLAL